MTKRPSPRRAWLSLLCGAVLLVGINFAANEWLPSQMTYWRDFGFYYRQAGLIERIQTKHVATVTPTDKKPFVVVMLGTSRVLNGFDGAPVEQTLQPQFDRPVVAANLGTLGAGPVHSLMNLGRLLRHGPRPDVVLIEAFPPYLREEVDTNGLTLTLEKPDAADLAWLASWEIELPQRLTNQPHSPFAIYDYRVELLRASRLPLKQNSSVYRKADYFGALKVADTPLDSPRRIEAMKHAVETTRDSNRNYHVGGPGWKAIAAMLQACRDSNIAAAVVIMPEGPALRDSYPSGVPEQFRTKIDELVCQYDSVSINGWEWMNEDSFRDSHHLMTSGARAFSHRLAQELLSEPKLVGAESHQPKLARRND